MKIKKEDSLVSAIEGNFSGMAHSDLVLTCEMLTRGRAAWQKECEDAHAVLDDPECLIIRKAKDGYPDGRPDRTLTLAERVKALLRMKMDYKRWVEKAQQERDDLKKNNMTLFYHLPIFIEALSGEG